MPLSSQSNLTNYIDWESRIGTRPSSPAWRVSLKSLYGIPLDDDELSLFRKLAKRDPPVGGASEAIFVVGRRGGKSETMARLAVYEALEGGHGAALAPGQIGVIAIIGAERAQALEVIRYASGIVNSTPGLKRKLADGGDLVESITFRSGITIKILSASSTSVRSGTIVCAILDEAAFLDHEPSADPDVAIVEALRPGLTPLIGAPPRRLIAISSAGVRDGWLYDEVQAHHGRDDAPTLVMVGTTEDFNPNIDPAYLAKRKAANAATYAREYESVFSDVITAGWFGPTIAQATDVDRVAPMPYELGLKYRIAVDVGFDVDPTGIAVATSRWIYTDKERTNRKRLTHVVYAERLPVPLDVHRMIEAVRRVCERYGTSAIYIDQFSSKVLVDLFSSSGIRAIKAPWVNSGADSKWQRFARVREAMADGSCRLPNDPILLSELGNVRGVSLPGGGERLEASIGHDDVAHACVLATSIALASAPAWPSAYLTRQERESQGDGLRRVVMGMYGC